MGAIDDNFWPASLAHLTEPYLVDSSQYVTIGEISGEPANDFPGTTLLYTAMVPAAELDQCLQQPGGIGHGISSSAGDEIYNAGGAQPAGAFWIESRRPDHKRYQALVESWQVHDRHIVMPFNGLLEHYGLSPEVLAGQTKESGPTMVWHDLSVPTYDVVRVSPLSIYDAPSQTSTARVEILREYLEDYLLNHNCVALASQWEGRYSTDDPLFDSVVGTHDGLSEVLSGRELWLKRVDHIKDGNQWSDTWCTRLVMRPAKALNEDQTLTWPDHDGPITGSGIMGGFGVMEEAYVRDEVLQQYEDRSEFDIHPETGMVGHGSWWSVSFCRRVGRDHIALELRKLYEGAQFSVIKHYAQYAVKEDSVPEPSNELEKRNIGIRAHEFIDTYLTLADVLASLCDAAQLPYTAEEIGGLSRKDIDYKGWWTFSLLGRLGNVAPVNMTYFDFLARCKYLFAVLESMKAVHLRALLMKLQVPKKEISDLEALKLCAYLCQLATIAKDEDWGLFTDAGLVIKKWDKEKKFNFYKPLFALNVLRTIDAHGSPSIGDPGAQSKQLEVFGIDPAHFKSAGGIALDRVYDELIGSLRSVTSLLLSIRF
jgi:hypothetical protein